jgi:hypothetical protein
MTKKKQPATGRTLKLKKETIRDLNLKDKAKQVKGGGIIKRCTGGGSGCLN